jgi:bifunctional ADP-heptose synthase (sugar kinase/adenylyltransferase)
LNLGRFDEITGGFGRLRMVLAGDFCLDRYLEIDPGLGERSIETGLPVYNVVRTRPQPGGAGTILNNLVALGVGRVDCAGFCGLDGEGWELLEALRGMPGVCLDGFVQTGERRTFTYTKPLLIEGGGPRELSRLDMKNWSPTPEEVGSRLASFLEGMAGAADAMIFLDQVDVEGTGVLTAGVLESVRRIGERWPSLLMVGDSRRGLRHFPPVVYKMNEAELCRWAGADGDAGVKEGLLEVWAAEAARASGRMAFVTRAERGILGANPAGLVERVAALSVEGSIDIVGAGDAVTASLAAGLAAGATMREAMGLAMLAASVVIHKVGTTGTASVEEMRARLSC